MNAPRTRDVDPASIGARVVESPLAAVALIAILAPVMETGTDPTRIPLAVLVAPPVAAVVTGMLSLWQANLESSDVVDT